MKKPIIYGIIGSLSLLLVYFIILIIANSFQHAITQFLEMWYFILILIIGFGIQVSLYTYVKAFHNKMAAASVSASGGASTTSMIACCAHHISDLLPILGLSAAALFLVKYQTVFILVGIFSNLIGINFMLSIMKKHNLFDNNHKLFKRIMNYDLKFILKLNVILSIIIILISINYIGGVI